MGVQLYDYQIEAIERLRCGSILCGGVGSGKSLTALGYYYLCNGGTKESLQSSKHDHMKNPRDLYIITTAKKRDSLEWEGELHPFLMTTYEDLKTYDHKVVIDSWNNIGKYSDIQGAFFIFDEQRLVGNGAWVKAFLKIAKVNEWILLSATPGDTWSDYIPVFLANGFYKNRTEFSREHIVYSKFTKFPKIDRYVNTKRLIRLRDLILVDMDFERKTEAHHEDVYVRYDISAYKDVIRTRTNPYIQGFIPCSSDDPDGLLIGRDIKLSDVDPILPDWDYEPEKGDYVKFVNQPLKSAGELCYLLRKIVNSDESRQLAVLEIVEKHPRAIIFYNFDYELDILKSLYYGEDVEIAEWNGHAHQPVPEGNKWIYLVQYTAGCEGWNCIKTDTIIFYSQNYSYKVMAQASGRIDRLNTPFKHLYYYHLKSRSGIDLAISRALDQKRKFNVVKFVKW